MTIPNDAKVALDEALIDLNNACGANTFYLEYRRSESQICLVTVKDDKLVFTTFDYNEFFYYNMLDYMRAMIKGIAIGIALMNNSRQ